MSIYLYYTGLSCATSVCVRARVCRNMCEGHCVRMLQQQQKEAELDRSRESYIRLLKLRSSVFFFFLLLIQCLFNGIAALYIESRE